MQKFENRPEFTDTDPLKSLARLFVKLMKKISSHFSNLIDQCL